MSRDPLEGVRPSDSERPNFSFSPPPVSVDPVMPSVTPVTPGAQGGRSRGKVLALVYIGILVLILAGGFAYFMSIPHKPLSADPTSPVAPAPSPTATSSGEVVVNQGPPPPDAPAPTAAAK